LETLTFTAAQSVVNSSSSLLIQPPALTSGTLSDDDGFLFPGETVSINGGSTTGTFLGYKPLAGLNGRPSDDDAIMLVAQLDVSMPGTDFYLFMFYDPTPAVGTPASAGDFASDVGGFASLLTGLTLSYTFCFLAGTQIATRRGEKMVEEVTRDDVLCTADGGTSPVKWIGRQKVRPRFSGTHVCPVRIRAGALGAGLPKRDLVVTSDHGLILDGYMINASALMNGDTIHFVPTSELGESYTVYHIETENHDVILAEGAPAETFIDYAARRAFDNYAEYVTLYGEECKITEMPHPRISAARMLPAGLKRRLAFRKVA